MLNKVTKLPKSRFYVFGFGEKKQFVGRNATPNMGWLVEFITNDTTRTTPFFFFSFHFFSFLFCAQN